MMCFKSHSVSDDAPTTRRMSLGNWTKMRPTTSSDRATAKLIPRLSAKSYKSTNLTDQLELNDTYSDEQDDGKEMELCKITFGCNQRFPSVALSPQPYPRMGTKPRSGHNLHCVASSSLLDLSLQISVHLSRSDSVLQMFRSRSKRRDIKYSAFATDLDPKWSSQKKPAPPRPMSSSDFDAMLRSNQTIYVQGVTTNTSDLPRRESREVLYSNIPLSSNQKPAAT